MIIMKDKKYRDQRGETIYFKEPYFDDGLRRRFNSIQEKAEFINKRQIVSTGDSDEKVKRERKQQYEKEQDEKKRR